MTEKRKRRSPEEMIAHYQAEIERVKNRKTRAQVAGTVKNVQMAMRNINAAIRNMTNSEEDQSLLTMLEARNGPIQKINKWLADNGHTVPKSRDQK